MDEIASQLIKYYKN
jgi:hypothetical protein